jgi:hypothetical protein
VEGEVVTGHPFETGIAERVPGLLPRLRSSYDARFYQQEVLGSICIGTRARNYVSERERNVAAVSVDKNRPLLWARISTWIR